MPSKADQSAPLRLSCEASRSAKALCFRTATTSKRRPSSRATAQLRFHTKSPRSGCWCRAFRRLRLRVFRRVLAQAALHQRHPQFLVIVGEGKEEQVVLIDHALFDQELEIDQLRPVTAIEQHDGDRRYFARLVKGQDL